MRTHSHTNIHVSHTNKVSSKQRQPSLGVKPSVRHECQSGQIILSSLSALSVCMSVCSPVCMCVCVCVCVRERVWLAVCSSAWSLSRPSLTLYPRRGRRTGFIKTLSGRVCVCVCVFVRVRAPALASGSEEISSLP